jgi:hypothetical protein
VNFERDDLGAVEAAVARDSGRPGAASLLSPGVVAITTTASERGSALALRDPDGHADVLWTQPPGAPKPTLSSRADLNR